MKSTLLVSACAALLLMQCATKEPAPAPVTPPVLPPAFTGTLRSVSPFPFGGAVSASLLRTRPAYSQLAAREYSSITAENAMKMGALHPTQTTYNWTDADYIVDFAQQNNARVHGHTLNWYTSLPGWVTNFTGDSTAWENLLRDHITTVVTHFKGKVASWDVVNEAFEDTGVLRNSIWTQHLGNDYIARAFQYAHAADPAALLFYNDYGHEYSTAKRTAIFAFVTALKARGIPIHGVGLQFHTSSNISDAQLATAIAEAGKTGLQVHISELDISMNPGKVGTATFTTALAVAQKVKYKAVVTAFKALPAAQRFGITTWNVADADSWRRGNCSCPEWPLPFDDNYQRKPAYDGIVEAFQ
jgi:endo-1,4-beta-xylanase